MVLFSATPPITKVRGGGSESRGTPARFYLFEIHPVALSIETLTWAHRRGRGTLDRGQIQEDYLHSQNVWTVPVKKHVICHMKGLSG